MSLPVVTQPEGVFFDMPFRDYLAAPGFSQSMSKHMNPPARLTAYMAEKREQTDEQLMGTLVHARILDPSIPLPRIAVTPERYPSGLDSKPWHMGARYCRDWVADRKADGLVVMSGTEYNRLPDIIDAIRSNESAADIFSTGKGEVSVFNELATDHGLVLCKSRLDWVPEQPFLADIKVVQNGMASPEEFAQLVHDRDYDVQAYSNLLAWNRQGSVEDGKSAFLFVVVERNPPFLVNVLRVCEGQLQAGMEKWDRRLRTYARCVRDGVWPGYTIGPNGYTTMTESSKSRKARGP